MTAIDPKLPVLVTGASGYIASWIVKYLLEEGHTVHATVRDPARKESVAHLEAIAAKAPGTLKLFKADLLDQGCFDAAMLGCELVIHTASPFVLSGYTDANEALVRPAVEGTRNVLDSVNRTGSVKRVVLTSSIAAICGDNADLATVPGGVYTEEHWNTSSSVDHNPYQYSKVAAEREAWRLHDAQKPRRWDLVVINPVMVYGPSLTRSSASGSIDTLLQMGRGKMRTGVPSLEYGFVDVRDVARAHLRAGFIPAAKGRHILSSRVLGMIGMAQILRQHFGNGYRFPRRIVPKPIAWLFGPLSSDVTRKFLARNVGWPLRIDNSKSRTALDIQYRPVEETLTEHFQQVVDDGLVRRRGGKVSP